MYQPKTTIINIGCMRHTEHSSDVTITSMRSAELAVATKIALRCQMDIMSVSHRPADPTEMSSTTVVYVNNGTSLHDIIETMRPEFQNNPSSYWQILDIYEWQGLLDCVVSARGTGEEW